MTPGVPPDVSRHERGQRPRPCPPGQRHTRVRVGRMREALGLSNVACMRCIRSFSSDYHQKWPRTGFMSQMTATEGHYPKSDGMWKSATMFIVGFFVG